MESSFLNITPNIAVIGAGYWGKNLVRNYYQLGALKLICDIESRVLTQFESQYFDVDRCQSLSDVLARDDITGVVIATPADTHFTIAKKALLKGVHVQVEKPLVLDEREGEELMALAAEKKKILMVGHLIQYHPVFVRFKGAGFIG